MDKKTPIRCLIPLMLIAVVVAIALLAARWRQLPELDRLRDENAGLLKQNERLQKDLTRRRAESPRQGSETVSAEQAPASGGPDQPVPATAIGQDQTAPAQEAEPEEPASTASANPAPPPEAMTGAAPVRLTLAGTEAEQVQTGLAATIRFKPDRTGPLGELALVVRVRPNGDAKILGLKPGESTMYTNITGGVSENGSIAVFQGIPQEGIEDIRFSLSVSGPATADVRGTCGIEPFQLKIGTEGLSVLPPAH